MNFGWQSVPLKEIIIPQQRLEIPESGKVYRQVGVRLWGKGVYERDAVDGANTQYKTFNQVNSGDIIINKIWARNGSVSVVPKKLKNLYCSSEFPIFISKDTQLSPEWFYWITKTRWFWRECDIQSRGTSGKNRIRPEKFLEIKIPLPSPEEQKQIVKKLEIVAAKIEEAKQLRDEILSEAQEMLSSAFHKIIKGAKYRPMQEVAPIVRRKVEIDINGEYAELGVRSFGKGTFHKPSLSGFDVGTKKLYSIIPGDIVFSNVFAWEKAIAVAHPSDIGRVGSHRFITCVAKQGEATANFLKFYFLTEEGIEKIREASPGGAGRNRTLGLKKLEKIEVPIPDFEKQLWFDQLQEKVAEIRKAQAQNQVELDALLPSILDKAFKGELIKSVSSASVSASKKTEISIPKDTAVICILIDELRKRDRSTDEFFLQKHAYAGKHCFDIPVGASFEAKAAGPWSKELTYETMAEGVERGWFKWEAGKYPNLIPGQFFSAALERAKNSLGEDNANRVVKVVRELNRFQAPGLGVWATILKIVVDLKKDDQKITRDAIQRVMDLWPGKRNKKDFSKSNVDGAITKMMRRGWIELDS